MTDSTAKSMGNSGQANLVPFKKGYDPRRWLKGRPKKPATKKLAEELIEHVIWDVFSEDIEHPITKEKVDRLRAMIRSMTTSRQASDKQYLLDTVKGKVSQPVELGGEVTVKAPEIIEIIKSYKDDESIPPG